MRSAYLCWRQTKLTAAPATRLSKENGSLFARAGIGGHVDGLPSPRNAMY